MAARSTRFLVRRAARPCRKSSDSQAGGVPALKSLRRPPGRLHRSQEAIMGLLSFVKEAGEKLFGKGDAKEAQAAVAAAPTPENVAALSAKAGAAIAAYVQSQGLDASGLDIAFDGLSSTVTVSGSVPDQATKEKVLLCCGNVAGVVAVNDLLVVNAPAPESQWHVVVSGDNLSKIAKKFYGDANKYPLVFEANKPMLGHPDKIYPGQMLRIPPLG
jgi:nucleoid-associated protein YgaU